MTHLFGKFDRPFRRLFALSAGVWLASIASDPARAVDISTDASPPRLLAVPITENQSGVESDLQKTDLTVLLDGKVQSIREIYLPDSELGQTTPRLRWQVMVYFDTPLSTKDGLRKAAQTLSREVERLALLGPIEIVVADPVPRIYLEASEDSVAVREALLDIGNEALNTADLQWHRQRFASSERDQDAASASRAWRDEAEILARHRAGLFRWTTQQRSADPKLLILVQSGHDLNPRTFYDQQAGGTFLEDPQNGPSQTDLARAIAGEGWMVLTLALGPKPKEFADPSAPLFELARATGGEVIHRHRDLTKVLDRARHWPILVLEFDGDLGPDPQPLEILHFDHRALRTTKWASSRAPDPSFSSELTSTETVQSRPALRLLRPEGIALSGELRLRTVAGRKRIDRVVFSLDDEVVAESARSPFSALVDLGPQVRPCKVSAVAFSKSGRKLGEDSMRLNMALQPPIVTIERLVYDHGTGLLELHAAASTPSGLQPERVEIYFNDQPRTVLDQPPFTTEVLIEELQPTDVVRVVATYPNGDVAEAAEVPGMTGPREVMDVNLVELLAMVTPRNRKAQIELERSDFLIRQEGQQQPIDHFSRWEELQLTLGLVLDTSESMEKILEDAREAGERFFADALRGSDEAFIVDFNDLPRLVRQTTSNSSQLMQSLTGLEARGDTALYDAIVFALQQFEDTSGRRALVVVTDGEDSASYYQPSECVRQARLHGVPVYLIVLGSPPDPSREPSLLRNLMIAQRSGGEVYYISDLDDLEKIYDQIVGELRRQYFLAFNAGHTLTPAELKQIQIEVLPKGVSVRTLLASQQRGG